MGNHFIGIEKRQSCSLCHLCHLAVLGVSDRSTTVEVWKTPLPQHLLFAFSLYIIILGMLIYVCLYKNPFMNQNLHLESLYV